MLGVDLVYAGYRIAGIIEQAGRGYSPSQGNDGLLVLNSLLDSLQSERLMVPATIGQPLTVVPGKVSYLIGPTGDLQIPRPEKIEAAGWVFTSTQPNVEVLMECWNDQEWEAQAIKSFSSPIATAVYYRADPGNGTLFPWPIPTNNAIINLYCWESALLNTIPNLNTAFILPPAYQEMLEYQLALRLAARFPTRQQMSNDARQIAIAAKRKVKNVNDPIRYAQCELASGSYNESKGRWNILSSTWRSSLG